MAVQKHEKEHVDYMPDYAIELAILTGMRVGEIAALQWSCISDEYISVDFSEHRLDYLDRPSELIIGEPKNNKHRKIPMTAEIRSLLERIKVLQTYHEDGFVFSREDGRRYTGHDISCAAARRGNEAGLEKVSIHEIRRTVSSMLREKIPVKAVANMLGHLETTNDRYYYYDITDWDLKMTALSEVSSIVIDLADLAVS